MIYRKRRVSIQDRVLAKGVRGEQKLPTGENLWFLKSSIRLNILEKLVLLKVEEVVVRLY